MDFFAAQDRARRQTRWLLFGFGSALLSLTIAFYLLVWWVEQMGAGTGDPYSAAAPVVEAWDPRRLLWVLLAVIGIVGGASFFKITQYRAGGGAVARSLGGRKVDGTTRAPLERRLVNVVEEMSIASGVPVPEIYVLDEEPAINAFAAGYGPDEAAIAVSRGCLDRLSRDELQGVVAHEFSHILNGDMRLNLKLAGILYGLFVLAIIGRSLLFSMRFARGGSGRRGGGAGVAGIVLIGLGVFLLGLLGRFFGRVIQSAISRQREYLADASAVQFTRYPAGIRDALRRIGGNEVGSGVQHQQAEALAHSFFASALRSSFGGMFRTHPPLERRIRELDPHWDGSYLKAAAPREQEKEKEKAPAAGKSNLRAARLIAAAGAVPVVLHGHADQLKQAGGLRARVEAFAREGIDDPEVAETVLLALFAERAGEGPLPWDSLESLLGYPVRARVERCRADLLEGLPRTERLSLFELTLPALQTLERSRLEILRAATGRIIEADQQVELPELSLALLLDHRLESEEERAKEARGEFKHPRALLVRLSRVLSLLALSAARGNEEEAGRLLQSVVGVSEGWEAVSFVRPDPVFLREDFRHLRRMSPSLQRVFLENCRGLVLADDIVTIEEAELYRLVGLLVGVPMPPLQPEAAEGESADVEGSGSDGVLS